MLKLSTLLKEAATKTAAQLLENGLTEANIPDVTGYIVSSHSDAPEGYNFIDKISVEGVTFFIYQLL